LSDREYFSFPKSPRSALRSTHTTSEGGPIGLTAGVKRLQHEADHSPVSSAEVKNEWSRTFNSPYAFMAYTRNSSHLLHVK